jgi:hypothetical protein
MRKQECLDIIRKWQETVAEWETKAEAASISELPTHLVIGSGMTSVIMELSGSKTTFVCYIDDNKLWTCNSATIADRVRKWVNDAYAYADAESHLAGAIQALTEINACRVSESLDSRIESMLITRAIANLELEHGKLCDALTQSGYKGSW